VWIGAECVESLLQVPRGTVRALRIDIDGGRLQIIAIIPIPRGPLVTFEFPPAP